MAVNLVESERVTNAIKELFPNRTLKCVLSRGSLPKNTFKAVFEDDPRGELVTILPRPRKKPGTANARPPQAEPGSPEANKKS
jgi:hypothetical protein